MSKSNKIKTFTPEEIIELSKDGTVQILQLIPPKDGKTYKAGTQYFATKIKYNNELHRIVISDKDVVITNDNNPPVAKDSKEENDMGTSFTFTKEKNPKLYRAIEILDQQKDVEIKRMYDEKKLVPNMGNGDPVISPMVETKYSRQSKAKDADGKSLAGKERAKPQGRLKFDLDATYNEKYYIPELQGKPITTILDADTKYVENGITAYKPFTYVNEQGQSEIMSSKNLHAIIKRNSVISHLRIEMEDVINHKFGVTCKVIILRAVIKRAVVATGYDDEDDDAAAPTTNAAGTSTDAAIDSITNKIITNLDLNKESVPANIYTDD